MPSTRKPRTSAAIAFWKARTDASVFGPNRPSPVSVRPSLRFRKLIWSCTARTAGPALPRCTVTTSARQVDAWTTPDALRPLACWNATTAAAPGGHAYGVTPDRLRPTTPDRISPIDTSFVADTTSPRNTRPTVAPPAAPAPAHPA